MSLSSPKQAEQDSAAPDTMDVLWRLLDEKASFRGTPTVPVAVGEEKVVFHVHKDFLCGCSSFFKAALASNFKEGTEQAIELPDDDPDTFELFLWWVYAGELKYLLLADDTEEETNAIYSQLVKLFVLGDKYGMPRLKDHVIDQLLWMKKKPCPPQLDVICYAYDNTQEASPLRLIMASWLAWHVQLTWCTSSEGRRVLTQCPDLAVDLTILLAKRQMNPNMESPLDWKSDLFYDKSILFAPPYLPTEYGSPVKLVRQDPSLSKNEASANNGKSLRKMATPRRRNNARTHPTSANSNLHASSLQSRLASSMPLRPAAPAPQPADREPGSSSGSDSET